MWKAIYELARSTVLIMTVSADDKNGKLQVTLTPKPAKAGENAALAHPLVVKATPEELDEGFAAAVGAYADSRSSLKEGLESALTVMEAAKLESQRQAAKSVSKATGRSKVGSPSVASQPATVQLDEGDDGDETETQAGDSRKLTAESTQSINLFG